MKRSSRQLSLFKQKLSRQFGGTRLKGNAKVARPLSTKHAIHLVLKSELAKCDRSFLRRRNSARIDQIVRGQARAKGIRLYHFVNVGNHLHLVLRLERATPLAGRRAFHSFIRAVTGLIARQVLSAERGQAKGIRFWQARPFTRIVSWGRDYNRIKAYMTKNSEQAGARRHLIDWGFGFTSERAIAQMDTG